MLPQATLRVAPTQNGLRNSVLRIFPAPDNGSASSLTLTLRGSL